MTSKIVRIKLRVDAEARLNSNKLNEYLYEMNHLSENLTNFATVNTVCTDST